MDACGLGVTRGSGVGLDRESVAIRILEPRDATAPGSRSDSFRVVLVRVVADELDANSGEFLNYLVDVIDVPIADSVAQPTWHPGRAVASRIEALP